MDPITESESTFISPGGALFRRSVAPPDPWATLALVHGYGDHSGRHLHVLRFLATQGIACHALDLRGQGRSAGRRGFARRWTDYLDDLNAFIALPEFSATKPLFLLGHSHGALIVTAGLLRGMPNVAGCILTSPFFRSRLIIPGYKKLLARLINPIVPWMSFRSGLSDGMMTSDPAMKADSIADPLICRVATPRWYVGCLAAQQRVLSSAAQFAPPLLLLFGGADPIADITAAQYFFQSASSADKQMKVYPGLLHEILRESARDAVCADILRWLRGRWRQDAARKP